MNKRYWLWVSLALLALVLLRISLPPRSAGQEADDPLCVPYDAATFVVETELVDIGVEGNTKILKGKWYYPKPISGGNFGLESLPGIAMTHGIGSSFAEIENAAENLARRCFVVLIFNHRGQGPHSLVNTEFTFYGEAERDDLADVTLELKDGPPGAGDIVGDTYLGFKGDSQGSLTTWIVIADNDHGLRGSYRAAIPHNSAGFMSQVLLPQDCISANAAALFHPNMVRTPWPTVANAMTATTTATPQPRGIAWNSTTYNELVNAYVTSHPPLIPTWQTAVATRDPGPQLAVVTPGTPYPYVYAQVSPYDPWQWTDETIAGWQTVTAVPTPTPAYPPQHLFIYRGGHADPNLPWDMTSQEKINQGRAWGDWFQNYLGPFYATAPTATTVPGPGTPIATALPTPLPTPANVVFYVDSFRVGETTPTPLPTFERKESISWPPGTASARETAVLYLHRDSSGTHELNLTAPAVETPDSIGQDYSAGNPPYNMATAVGGTRFFDTWSDHIQNTGTLSVTYISPPLNQDVILVGPPTVNLYAEAATGYDDYPLQVHVRIKEQLDNAFDITHFITRANACAWTEAQDDGWFTGEDFDGETRVHKFKAGNRIVVEVTTVDREEYHPDRGELFITPYLGDLRITIFHHINGTDERPTSVSLPLLWSDTTEDLFQSGGGLLAEGDDDNTFTASQDQAEPDATPPAPLMMEAEPLTIEATLYSDYTNPGGWRAWAPEVLFDCSGGAGAVTCPADTVLTSDGINQSFVFTATDSVGTVVSTTVPNVTIDRTPPLLTTTLPESQTFCSGSTTQLDFSVSDALSGLFESTATFNGQLAEDNDVVSLLAGANTLSVNSRDVAGNRIVAEEILQANYDETLDFPPNGGNVNPLLPLAFAFQVNDACAAQGWYAGATGTLWLTGPDGEEIPAEWYGLPTGNEFTYNALTGWYAFDADLTGLTPGTWTARAHLDDGTDHIITFVIPGGLGGEAAEDTTATAVRPACQDGWLRPLLGVGRCR